MKNIITYCYLLLLYNIFFSVSAYSQVCRLKVTGGTADDKLSYLLIYDKTAKLLSITTDNLGGKAMQEIMPLTTIGNLQLPPNNKTTNVSYSNGGIVVTTNGNDDNEPTNKMTFNKQGKIIEMETFQQGSISRFSYTYNNNGDAIAIKWKIIMTADNSTSEATITPTYNTGKFEILPGSPMTALVKVSWLFAPMTNTHLLTGYTKTQAMNIGGTTRTLNETRDITYIYDKAGRVGALNYSVNKLPPKTIHFSYESCK